MKKSIVYLGLALVMLTNISTASNGVKAERTAAVEISITPLCAAISKGDVEFVRKYVTYGADVNQRSNGMTPLMIAARYNNVEIIKILLDKGADLNAKNEKGLTALKIAQLSNANDASRYLAGLQS